MKPTLTAAVATGIVLGICGDALADRCLRPGLAYERSDLPEKAAQMFRVALELPACQTPDMLPLVQFSLGRALLTAATDRPMAACEAVEQLEPLVDGRDSSVSSSAADLLADARPICRRAQTRQIVDSPPPRVEPGRPAPTPTEAVPDRPPLSPSTAQEDTPPPIERDELGAAAMVDPERTAEPSHPDRWHAGVRVAGGVARLGMFESDYTVLPGPLIRLGLLLERQFSDRWHLSVEPGVCWQAVGFDNGIASGAWRWWLLELPVIARVDLPIGVHLIAGLSGALVVAADESTSTLGETAFDLEARVRPWSTDALLGLGYAWHLDTVDLRVEGRFEHGIVGVDASEAATTILAQRFTVGVGFVY